MSKFTMEVTKDRATLTLEIKGQKFVERWKKKGRGWWGALDHDLAQQAEEAGIKISEKLYDAIQDRELTGLMDYLPREPKAQEVRDDD